MTASMDYHLLFGIVALQMGLVQREQLLVATRAWLEDKSQSLETFLIEQGALSPDDRDLLKPLVVHHWENHSRDTQRSLAALSDVSSVAEELRSLGDEEVDATLSHISTATDPKSVDPTLPHASHAGGINHADAAVMRDGRFRILHSHAKGGLGEVYVARDTELNREVAVKEIQSKYADDESSRLRFLLEAEVTGGLEHPGIVPVYGLGRYADGRPFYAMRFIRGHSLKEAVDTFHARARPTDTQGTSAKPINSTSSSMADFCGVEFRKLLGRFIDVCQAIEYAHSRGVLHRDLKPGNIMLGKYGETLVVDWGLAKTQESGEHPSALDEATLRPASASGSAPTIMGTAIGTPAFMAPEQAAGRLDRLGRTSDVYSLGATLYYLLTGRPPYTQPQLQDLLAKVAEGDFPRPRQINAQIPTSLEAICLKAMSRQQADRYATPNELAEDVENWLADERVIAHRESALTIARRWMRKHPRTVAATEASVAVAVAGLFVFLFVITQKNQKLAEQYSLLVEANRQTEEARDLAAANLRQAQQAVEEFYTEVSQNEEWLAGSQGTQQLRSRLLEKARSYYEDFLEKNRDARLDADVATAHHQLCKILRDLGRGDEAMQSCQRARDIWAARLEADPDDEEARSQLAKTYLGTGVLKRDQGDLTAANADFRQSGEVLQPLVDSQPDNPEHQAALALSLGHSAVALHELGESKRAAELHQQAISIQETLVVDSESDQERYQNNLGNSYHNLALVLMAGGKLKEAGAHFEKAVVLRQELTEDYPFRPQYKYRLSSSYSQLGAVLQGLNEMERSQALQQKTIDLLAELVHDNPAVPKYRVKLADKQVALSNLLASRGRIPEALEMFQSAIAVMEAQVKNQPSVPNYQHYLGLGHFNFGNLLFRIGKAEEAAQAYQRAVALLATLTKEHSEKYEYHWHHAVALMSLAGALEDTDQFEQAMMTYRDAVGRLQSLMAQHPESDDLKRYLSGALINMANSLKDSKPEEAVIMQAKANKTLQSLAEQHPERPEYQNDLATSYLGLGNSYSELGQKQQAKQAFEAGIQFGGALVDKFPTLFEYRLVLAGNQVNLAGIFLDDRRHGEAIKKLDAAAENLRQVRDAAPTHAMLKQMAGVERRKRAQCLQEMAWQLATDPSDAERDGKQAVAWATEACELSGWTQAVCLDTLAAAYAETGDFDKALKWAEQAIDALPANVDERILQTLTARRELFESGVPFRRPQRDNGQLLDDESD